MSNKLSWFSGGGERSQEAVVIIDALVSDLASQPTTEPLKQVLRHYSDDFKSDEFGYSTNSNTKWDCPNHVAV